MQERLRLRETDGEADGEEQRQRSTKKLRETPRDWLGEIEKDRLIRVEKDKSARERRRGLEMLKEHYEH